MGLSHGVWGKSFLTPARTSQRCGQRSTARRAPLPFVPVHETSTRLVLTFGAREQEGGESQARNLRPEVLCTSGRKVSL